MKLTNKNIAVGLFYIQLMPIDPFHLILHTEPLKDKCYRWFFLKY